MLRLSALLLSASVLFSACSQSPGDQGSEERQSVPITGSVNVYSARHYDSDLALYEQFTSETGIKVNLLEGNSDQLIQRIENEAEFSPADVLITVDAGRLWRAVDRGVFQTLDAPEISERVPANIRNDEDYWIGLTRRARVIVYNKSEGRPEGLNDYADLADPAFAGEICMRSSANTYNLSLMASIVAREGEDAAQDWAEKVVANFARPPQGNDISLLKSVAAGECGLTLANTYYIARLGASDDPATQEVYENLGIIFPNQDNTGTHVNISGIGIATYAPHRENAVKLIEFLTRDDIQTAFSAGNNEYPAVAGVDAAPQVVALGDFKADDLHASELGSFQEAAVKVYDRAGWK